MSREVEDGMGFSGLVPTREERELALAYRLRDAHHADAINARLELEELRDTNETLRKRVAELEPAGNRLGDAAITGILDGNDFRVRAEQAEAQLAEARVRIAELVNTCKAHVLIHQQRGETIARAERAEAERDAMRELLVNLVSAMTEHGTIMHPYIWKAYIEARAALTPSPVLIDDLGQVWPEDAPAGREG